MKKMFLIVLILISFTSIGLGIFGAINRNTNKNENRPNDNFGNVVQPSNKQISCVRSEYQDMYNAMVETTIDATFNENNYIDVFKTTNKFMFNDQANYYIWKQSYESNNIDMNVPGIKSFNSFDDANNVLINVVEQKYSEMPIENINNEFPRYYEELKYYLNFNGYFCTEK